MTTFPDQGPTEDEDGAEVNGEIDPADLEETDLGEGQPANYVGPDVSGAVE